MVTKHSVYSIYLYKSKFLSPQTVINGSGGPFMEVDPVLELQSNDECLLVQAIVSIMARGNPIIQVVSRGSMEPSPMLAATGLRTWGQVVKKSRIWQIVRNGDALSFHRMVLQSGGWLEASPLEVCSGSVSNEREFSVAVARQLLGEVKR